MAVLLLNQASVRDALRHPELIGKKRFARGEFSAVFDAGEEKVIKVTVDSIQYEIFTRYEWDNRHFPIVTTDHGIIGEQTIYDEDSLSIYMVEMERLVKLPRGGEVTRLVRKLVRKADDLHLKHLKGWNYDYTRATVDTLDKLSEWGALPESLRASLAELSCRVANYDGANLDIHSGNVMIRPSTGELVLSDPICDARTLIASRTKFQQNNL